MQQVQFEDLSTKEKEVLQMAFDAAVHYLNRKSARRVGASLLAKNGKVYQGASVRRTNISNSTCAERMALDRALFDKCYDYELLAVIGLYDDKDSKTVTSPCGLCRQILSEAETYGETRKPIPILASNGDFSVVIRTDSQELFPLAYEGKACNK